MPEIQFVFVPGDNVKSIPKPLSGKFELGKLVIEADDLSGLTDAIRCMRIYFRFDFGSPVRFDAKSIHLSKYIFATDALVTTINFNDLILEIDQKNICNNASVSIQDEIKAPVVKMTLTLNRVDLE